MLPRFSWESRRRRYYTGEPHLTDLCKLLLPELRSYLSGEDGVPERANSHLPFQCLVPSDMPGQETTSHGISKVHPLVNIPAPSHKSAKAVGCCLPTLLFLILLPFSGAGGAQSSSYLVLPSCHQSSKEQYGCVVLWHGFQLLLETGACALDLLTIA